MVLAASFRSEYRHMAQGVQVGDSGDRKRSVNKTSGKGNVG
jgi:hypothetical protein